MDEIRLYVALYPAGPLAYPVRQAAARFFPRCGIEHLRPVSAAVEPYSEVAVFGHVVGVPSAYLPQYFCNEMIRRAAERYGGVNLTEAWEIEVEPRRVLGREPAGEQVLVSVIEIQLRLKTDDPLLRLREAYDRLLQLVRLGPVLGIVYDEVLPLRPR